MPEDARLDSSLFGDRYAEELQRQGLRQGSRVTHDHRHAHGRLGWIGVEAKCPCPIPLQIRYQCGIELALPLIPARQNHGRQALVGQFERTMPELRPALRFHGPLGGFLSGRA